jgi:hypothetical protein
VDNIPNVHLTHTHTVTEELHIPVREVTDKMLDGQTEARMC